MDCISYTYALLDPRKPGLYVYGTHSFSYEPFYIGKGFGERINVHNKSAFNIRSKDYNSHKGRVIRKIFEEKQLLPYTNIIVQGLRDEEAIAIEQDLIKIIGRMDKKLGPLVNKTDGGDGERGRIFTPEHRKNMSLVRLGKFYGTDESRKSASQKLKGRIFSEEHRKKLSITGKGRRYSPEAIEKFRKVNAGRRVSAESIQKQRLKMMGHPVSEETRRKIGIASKRKQGLILNKSRTKIKEAKELLKNSGLEAWKIANQLGYKNLSSLSTLFKKTTGITMTSYKKSENEAHKAFKEIMGT